MALQLKNKVKEEKNDLDKSKKGKYKRKRNVFGKRLTRFGLIGLIIGLVIAFTVTKVVFTLNQNNKQNKIDNDLVAVNNKIKEYRRELGKKQDTYENVGELIATLPASFDQQATSLDIDRMLILSGLTENPSFTRKIGEIETLPIDCSINTVKAVRIEMSLLGKQDDVESALKLWDYLTAYNHENFYYIETFTYTEERAPFNRSSIRVVLYTFYNDVELKTETETNTNTTTTK